MTEPQSIVESNRDNATGRDFDKDSPLREDIRMLGRLLGDTIRHQEGADVFDLVDVFASILCASTAMLMKQRDANLRTRWTSYQPWKPRASYEPSAISRISLISRKIDTISDAIERICWRARRRAAVRLLLLSVA